MAANRQNNVRVGYDLAAEALNYLADKFSSIRDDNDQIRIELRLELDVNVEDWRAKAERLREIYNRGEKQEPAPGSKERESYLLRKYAENSFYNSVKGLVCVALGVYARDITRTRQDIPRQLITREPSTEQVRTYLRMDDVNRQLELIQEAMDKD